MQPDVVVVPFVELDIGTSAAFEDFLHGLRGCSTLVLDMTRVRFLDSTGMGVLIAEYKARQSNGSLKVTNLVPTVAKVFEVCDLTELFVAGQPETADPI